MRRTSGGKPFHGDMISSDLSSITEIPLFTADRVAITVAATERVVIEAYSMVTGSAVNVNICSGTSQDAGSILRGGVFAAKSGMAGSQVELHCKKGETPHILASDVSNIFVCIEGRIYSR